MTGLTENKNQYKILTEEIFNGIRVVKVFSFQNYRNNKLLRILYYTTYPLLAFIAAIRIKNPTIIITSTPPIFLLITGFLISHIKKKEYIVEVRDAWLEFAIARELVPKFMVRLLLKIQNYMYNKAKYIISVTPGIKKIVDSYTKYPEKNHLVMNGFEEDINMVKNDYTIIAQNIIKKYCLKDKFVVIYAGTLGMARDTDIFGRTANYLRKYKDIIFLFIGEGEKKQKLIQYCKSRNLINCSFISIQPRYMMPVFMNIADVGINAIRKNDALESSLSNKIFEYLGNGLSVVWAGDGDTSEFLNISGGGIVVEPENEKQMGEAILKLYNNPKLKQKISSKGKNYVLKNYKREKVMKSIDPILAKFQYNVQLQ